MLISLMKGQSRDEASETPFDACCGNLFAFGAFRISIGSVAPPSGDGASDPGRTDTL